MRVAIDTNRCVDLFRGDHGVAAQLEIAEEILVPFVVLAEMRAGFALGSRGADNERSLRQFLMKNGVSVLFPDEQTTRQYAVVYRQLRKQGTPIPTNDMWIAALVLQHSLILMARDSHFDHLPQIERA